MTINFGDTEDAITHYLIYDAVISSAISVARLSELMENLWLRFIRNNALGFIITLVGFIFLPRFTCALVTLVNARARTHVVPVVCVALPRFPFLSLLTPLVHSHTFSSPPRQALLLSIQIYFRQSYRRPLPRTILYGRYLRLLLLHGDGCRYCMAAAHRETILTAGENEGTLHIESCSHALLSPSHGE